MMKRNGMIGLKLIGERLDFPILAYLGYFGSGYYPLTVFGQNLTKRRAKRNAKEDECFLKKSL